MTGFEKNKKSEEILHLSSDIKIVLIWLPVILIIIMLQIWGIYYFAVNIGMDMKIPEMTISNPQLGNDLALQQGFACYGPEGMSSILNLSSTDKVSPGWNYNNQMGNNIYDPIIRKQENEHAAIQMLVYSPSDLDAQEYAILKMQPLIGQLTVEQIKLIMPYIYSINPPVTDHMVSALNNDAAPQVKFVKDFGDNNPFFGPMMSPMPS